MREVLGFAAGVLAWTIAEYAVHRFVLHGVCELDHIAGHHRNPSDYGSPSWISIVAFFLTLWLGLLAVGNGAQAAGFTGGYLLYAFVHRACHHDAPAWPWLRRLVSLHAAHHASGDVNFGVSTPLWDVICGTYRGNKKP